MTLDFPITLTIVGMLATFIATLATCTWYLASKASSIVASNKNLSKSMNDLTSSLNHHVMKSDTRDEDNKREHASIIRTCDSNVENIKSINVRLEKVEKQSDKQDDLLRQIDKRLAVLESKE